MECPKCSSSMELIDTDNRQEWIEETYVCNECEKSFLRRIEYQTQSSLVESDTLTEMPDYELKDELKEIVAEKLKQIEDRKK